MPIFEFACDKCHHEFEEVVFDDTTPVCPRCGAARTSKLISRPATYRRGAGAGGDAAAADSGGKCAGCAGGNCACCH